jgi:hypothetical protein
MRFSEPARASLESALGAGNHHSYLFISRSFANEATPAALVNLLLRKLSGLALFGDQTQFEENEFWEAFVRHPDLLRADPERATLRREDLDLFRERTLYPPTFARRRFLLIERAERMNMQSANALLKTIEEPHAQCVFVLTTARPAQIPSTITSRCQKTPLPSWDDQVKSARSFMEPEDAAFLEALFSATHLSSPPVVLPADSLFSSQKVRLSPKILAEFTQWSDTAGKKYHSQILRDAVVEITSEALKHQRLSQSRASIVLAEIRRWNEAEPFNPTNSFWLMRILLTLAI